MKKLIENKFISIEKITNYANFILYWTLKNKIS